MTFYIKKYKDPYRDVEYINAEDIFENQNEMDPKIQYMYMFLSMIADELNYYVHNSSTAFGNPDLAMFRGKIKGFLAAKQWSWDESKKKDGTTLISIRSKSGRLIMQIERPDIPESEFERRRQISKDLDALF